MNLAALLPLLRALLQGNIIRRSYVASAVGLLICFGLANGTLTPEEAQTYVTPMGMPADSADPTAGSVMIPTDPNTERLIHLVEREGAALIGLLSALGFTLRAAIAKHGKAEAPKAGS